VCDCARHFVANTDVYVSIFYLSVCLFNSPTFSLLNPPQKTFPLRSPPSIHLEKCIQENNIIKMDCLNFLSPYSNPTATIVCQPSHPPAPRSPAREHLCLLHALLLPVCSLCDPIQSGTIVPAPVSACDPCD
jgi:hypothetical protein